MSIARIPFRASLLNERRWAARVPRRRDVQPERRSTVSEVLVQCIVADCIEAGYPAPTAHAVKAWIKHLDALCTEANVLRRRAAWRRMRAGLNTTTRSTLARWTAVLEVLRRERD